MQKYVDLFNPSFLNDKEHKKELKPFPDDISLAMAYIPFQQEINAYESSKALNKGTLFKDLNKPFIGRKEVEDE